jgi:hypothetical protein
VLVADDAEGGIGRRISVGILIGDAAGHVPCLYWIRDVGIEDPAAVPEVAMVAAELGIRAIAAVIALVDLIWRHDDVEFGGAARPVLRLHHVR